MALKHKISKIEDVDEIFRSHYKLVDAADLAKGFVLDIDGAPQPEDTGALKRALERVRIEKDEALEALKQQGSTKEDIEAIRKSSDAQIKALKDKIADAENKARDAFLNETVSNLASELGGQRAGLLTPHIRQRLVIEFSDGVNIPRVLGKDGKASALSLEDLKNEIKSDELFAPVIQAGRASGSGASGGGSSAGGASGGTGRVGRFAPLPQNATAAETAAWLGQHNTPGFGPEA